MVMGMKPYSIEDYRAAWCLATLFRQEFFLGVATYRAPARYVPQDSPGQWILLGASEHVKSPQ